MQLHDHETNVHDVRRSFLSPLLPPSVRTLILLPVNRIAVKPGHHDVFINHGGVDTKQKPGDSLCHEIREAVLGCKVGVTVFSPRYSDSVSCLRELALLMEAEKKVIPIFCDVKPSKLQIVDLNGRFHSCTNKEVLKFRSVLDEAAGIAGLSFDSSKGD